MTLKRTGTGICVLLFSAILISGCGSDELKVTIGYDNTAEEAIIANMLTDLIEHDTDITVDLIGDLAGGETVLHPAITSGEIDLYPEYTGTAWMTILKHENIPEQDTLNKNLFQEYEDNFQLSWIGLYGFNNSYGLAVTDSVAEQYNLNTYSDLAAVSDQLVFGAESGFFERSDGYDGLCEEYGFHFKKHSDLTYSLKYEAAADKIVDVINIFTTDGRLSVSNVKVLEDDKNYFPKYYCGTVVRDDTIQKYPELKTALMKMDHLITDEEMSAMNKNVEVDGMNPEEVARLFLENKGLLNE